MAAHGSPADGMAGTLGSTAVVGAVGSTGLGTAGIDGVGDVGARAPSQLATRSLDAVRAAAARVGDKRSMGACAAHQCASRPLDAESAAAVRLGDRRSIMAASVLPSESPGGSSEGVATSWRWRTAAPLLPAAGGDVVGDGALPRGCSVGDGVADAPCRAASDGSCNAGLEGPASA